MDIIDTTSTFLDELEGATNPRFRYPLSYQDEYKGTIKFTALKADYQTLGSKLLGTSNATGATNALNDLIQEIEEFLNFFNDLEALLGGTYQSLEYNGVQHSPKGSVTMHMPTQLSFRDNIDYQNIAFGTTGSAAERALQENPGSLAKAAAAGAEKFFDNITGVIDAFKSGITSEAASIYTQKTLGKFSEPVSGAIEVTSGVTLNPNRRSLLRGVGIRTFGFTFKLIPNNAQEAAEIKKIIEFFRKNMYPDDIIENNTNVSIGYRYPNKFKIEMEYDGNPVASKILPCFLQGFDTNYNPNSMSFHKDGEFPEIDITLTFIEERALRRQDIVKGY